ncbi:MAG: hybrid sensor histidine kinase/response regulator [Cyanobacteria bacterium P01_D01_bin.105]
MSTSATILAVDDVPDNLIVLKSLLDDEDGYDLYCVDSGQAALDFVYKTPPDLILLDVMMPDMSGYDVSQRIRQSEKLPYIPILLVTANERSSVAEGLDSGADDFIRKPFDINELLARVRSLLRLKRSMDKQSDMLQQRDDFVARLTHDLRTPLVAANRVLHLCLEGVFGEPPVEMAEAINNVVTNNANLLNMTNTLLQVYRHEAGHKKLVRSPLSMGAIAKDVVKELRPLAEEKSLQLNLEMKDQDEDPYSVLGDRIELRRLLTNLLGNAIKFTDEGSITVRLSVEQREDGVDFVSTAVQDTGSGIDQIAQARIFEWFYQGKHMRAGSGLGLHLSKRIAEMHKGDITLSSKIGEGSIFTLVLPKLKQNAAALRKEKMSKGEDVCA